MFGTVKRILDWTGKYRKRLYLGCVCSFFAMWFSSAPILIASWALDRVLDDMNKIKRLEWSTVWLSLAGISASIAFRYFFSYWKARLQESIGDEVAAQERLSIGDILKRVSLGYFSKRDTGDILTVLTNELSSLELMGMKLVDSVLNGYINLLAIILLLLVIFPPEAPVVLAGAGISSLFLIRISIHSRKNAGMKQESQERITGAALEYIHGLPIVKSFGQEGVSFREWKEACNRHKDINLEIERGVVPNNCAHFLSLKTASVLLISLAGVFTLREAMTVSVFLLIAMFSFMIFGSVENMSDSVYMLGLIDTSLDKLKEIKEADFLDEDGKDLSISDYGIEFQHVSFGYREKEVLHDLSFRIPQKTTTAIVGPSGSGKTTICSLIMRFYDVGSGTIRIGGHDVREFSCDSLLKNISTVFQKVYLFNDTVRNNIKFGKPEATDEEVIEAAKKACCHDFISALPRGYDSLVGEGGSFLSGGEKQRISIARALLKDAPIVILDEATASVDPENEHLIQKAISELVNGKTIVTIAHRLSTIEKADQILVLDEGHLVQSGTHKQLLEKPGLYKDFIEIRKKTEGWHLS